MAEQPVGEMLRRTREERAITLEEAEAQTRIRKKFLQALESGDISALPSAAHARGFFGTMLTILVSTRMRWCSGSGNTVLLPWLMFPRARVRRQRISRRTGELAPGCRAV
ncbi:MAG: hypothetical protein GYB64_10600 [Chloroflexi bacterium]|nr:hypothetical protein [Chloroflexota bacterium]